MKDVDVFDSLREHCLSFAGSQESYQWDCMVFKVYGKIFALMNDERGPNVSLKADPELKDILVAESHIFPAPYMWHNGWVNVCIQDKATLKQAKDLISISFELILSKIPKSKRV